MAAGVAMRDFHEVTGGNGSCGSARGDVMCREIGVEFRVGVGIGMAVECLGIGVE